MKRVVAAIDNSAAARPVLTMAQAVASALGGTMEAFHVVEDGDETASASAAAAGVPLQLVSGDPTEQLVLATEDEDVVGIVLGARGSLGGPLPAGHLVLAIAGRTDKPVVAVPPGAQPPERLRRVLVAMEGSSNKARALQRTIELSTDAGLEIIVMHVDEEVPSFTDQVQHEVEAYTSAFFARHVHGAPEARLELRIGVPAVEVLDGIESLRPDLVAIGWPQSIDPARAAVAREILARSRVPVLLVAVA